MLVSSARLRGSHQRVIRVLQRRAVDLEVAYLVAVLAIGVVHEAGRMAGGPGEAFTAQRPPHLVVARDELGERNGCAVADDPAAVEDEDAPGEPLGLVEVVRGEQ